MITLPEVIGLLPGVQYLQDAGGKVWEVELVDVVEGVVRVVDPYHNLYCRIRYLMWLPDARHGTVEFCDIETKEDIAVLNSPAAKIILSKI